MNETIQKPLSGRRVFLMFLMFFGVIVAVNSVFITYALTTHSGVITKKPYEKGLKHDEYLQIARTQPKWNSTINYKNDTIRFQLRDTEEASIDDANVQAHFVRRIKSGDDFAIPLRYVSDGIYEARVDFPHKGVWIAKLDIEWNKTKFQTSHDLIIK